MCDLCGNDVARTYSHAKNPRHRKLLIQLFLKKKEEVGNGLYIV